MPALFYGAPPGDVPMLLAIGHEFVLGSYLGPPLAFWLGEVAFRIGGAFGLYVLAQACIVVTYWAVFTLGRAHRRHAPRGAWRSADGRHRRLRGAEPGFRPRHPGGAALGAGAAALLARGRRGRARRLVSARARPRPAAARKLRRADPGGADAGVHARQRRADAPRCCNPEPWLAVLPLRHRHHPASRLAVERLRSRAYPASTIRLRPALCRPACGSASRSSPRHLGLGVSGRLSPAAIRAGARSARR